MEKRESNKSISLPLRSRPETKTEKIKRKNSTSGVRPQTYLPARTKRPLFLAMVVLEGLNAKEKEIDLVQTLVMVWPQHKQFFF